MILQIFCLRDAKSVSYGNPMFLPSRGSAIRSVSDEVNRKDDRQNILANHPEDFELFVLGTFDTDSAVFDTHQPESVIQCAELVSRTN